MKKQIKKLTLSKETLRSLEDGQSLAVMVVGGRSGSICGNPTCIQDCRPTNLLDC